MSDVPDSVVYFLMGFAFGVWATIVAGWSRIKTKPDGYELERDKR